MATNKKSNKPPKKFGSGVTSEKYRPTSGNRKGTKRSFILKKGATDSAKNPKGTKRRSSVKITTGTVDKKNVGTITGKRKVKTNKAGTKSKTVTKAKVGGRNIKEVVKKNFKKGTATVKTKAKKVTVKGKRRKK